MTSQSGLVVARPGLVQDGLQAMLSAIPRLDPLEPADDGASCLVKLTDHCVDLIILDSSLSEGELCATLRQIKEGWPDVRCVAIAATPRLTRALETAGADAVLVEGFPASRFSATLKALLSKHHLKEDDRPNHAWEG